MRRSLAGRVRRGLVRRGVILLYHRVARPARDPWGLCVSPERFAEQMAWLARRYRVVPLARLVEQCTVRRLGRPQVAITFDDGYADNLTHAAPVLRHHRLPATFFVVSGFLGADRETWWDELERMLLRPEPLPGRLALALGDESRIWDLGEAARAWSPDEDAGAAPWEAAPGTRLHFLHEVWAALRGVDESRRAPALAQLRDWSGERAVRRDSHRLLDPEAVRQLAGIEGMEIGAHSVHHEWFPALPPAAQAAEIAGSRAALEQLLERPVPCFSYPFGARGPETPDLVRTAGFASACGTDPGIVWRGASRFALPRITARDAGAAALERQIADALH